MQNKSIITTFSFLSKTGIDKGSWWQISEAGVWLEQNLHAWPHPETPAYKQVRSYPAPDWAVSKQSKIMAVLGSTLPSLGLFLCLGMLFISASSANDSDSCMSFSAVIPTTGIMASSDVYEDNKVYTSEWKPFSLLSFFCKRSLREFHNVTLHLCSHLYKIRVFWPGWVVGTERMRTCERVGWTEIFLHTPCANLSDKESLNPPGLTETQQEHTLSKSWLKISMFIILRDDNCITLCDLFTPI